MSKPSQKFGVAPHVVICRFCAARVGKLHE